MRFNPSTYFYMSKTMLLQQLSNSYLSFQVVSQTMAPASYPSAGQDTARHMRRHSIAALGKDLIHQTRKHVDVVCDHRKRTAADMVFPAGKRMTGRLPPASLPRSILRSSNSHQTAATATRTAKPASSPSAGRGTAPLHLPLQYRRSW